MTTMTDILTYSELIKRKSFGDRLQYLKLNGVSHESPRYMSNPFYKSKMWLLARDAVIRRDAGCDLGVLGVNIDGPIFVHHMNPLQPSDLEEWSNDMIDPEFLICVSEETHNIIHYSKKLIEWKERKPGDTKLW